MCEGRSDTALERTVLSTVGEEGRLFEREPAVVLNHQGCPPAGVERGGIAEDERACVCA